MLRCLYFANVITLHIGQTAYSVGLTLDPNTVLRICFKNMLQQKAIEMLQSRVNILPFTEAD